MILSLVKEEHETWLLQLLQVKQRTNQSFTCDGCCWCCWRPSWHSPDKQLVIAQQREASQKNCSSQRFHTFNVFYFPQHLQSKLSHKYFESWPKFTDWQRHIRRITTRLQFAAEHRVSGASSATVHWPVNQSPPPAPPPLQECKLMPFMWNWWSANAPHWFTFVCKSFTLWKHLWESLVALQIDAVVSCTQ